MHQDAVNAVATLLAQGEEVCVVPQNLIEFWNVCTRPGTARGGLGLTPTQTASEIAHIESNLILIPDAPAIYDEWKHIVMTHNVHGVQVHDARLVAAMRVHGLTHLLTFNVGDFTRYPGIKVVHPSNV